ncbi:MAG: hypothetical protein ACOY3K_06025 [Candidatus Omnitrophota bacterium]
MTAKRIRPQSVPLRVRFFSTVRETSPWIVLRILTALLFFSPWMIYAILRSTFKMLRWKKVETCREFIRRNSLAFPDVDPTTLSVESQYGGISNSNQIWRCRTVRGEPKEYFVKVFVLIGSFWARHMSLVSPFPTIYHADTHERFAIDMVRRVELDRLGIPVPRLVAFDAGKQVMVTERLQGESVDEILKRIARSGSIEPADAGIIRQCGSGLARIHKTGYALIDTQPVNCIWVPEERKIYFTDLEFCTREDRRVWDVGFFLCFLAIRLPPRLKEEVRRLFLSDYCRERQIDLAGVSETGAQLKNYLPVFQMILDLRQFTPEELFAELITV